MKSKKYIELLEDIPDWTWNGYLNKFKNNIEYIIDFVKKNNRLPNRTNENEKYYSNWLNKMKKEYIIKSVNVNKLINYVLKKDTNKKVKIKKTNEYTKK